MATKLNEVLAAPARAAGPALLERISLRRIAVGLIPFTIAFAVYLLVFVEMRPLDSTGDEPHYLITAESIAYDFDLDLRNDYASSERVLRVVNVFPLGPNAAVYKDSGELRPFRGVALPALVAPGVALGGLTGARLVMLLVAALLADQLYRLLRDLRLRRRYRIPAWVSVVFCLPVLPFTSQFYPELPARSSSSWRCESWSAARLRPLPLRSDQRRPRHSHGFTCATYRCRSHSCLGWRSPRAGLGAMFEIHPSRGGRPAFARPAWSCRSAPHSRGRSGER